MKPFMDDDFLLSNQTARTLYRETAAKLPIIDYHCHINPAEIAENKRYETITDLWLGGDHYKWRALRGCGVPERLITGEAEPFEKFAAWAGAMPQLAGNPLYHWTHLELQRYFDVDEPLSSKNAKAVYESCNAALARPDMRVRGIIEKSRVELLCTTDDPLDSLEAHKALAAETGLPFRVLPAFRPDKAINVHKPVFADYIRKLEARAGVAISAMSGLYAALKSRLDFFAGQGCLVSDHALETPVFAEATAGQLDAILQKGRAGEPLTAWETEAYQTAVLRFLASEYARRGWVMQLHFGCIRDNSAAMFARLGPDTGYDAIHDAGGAKKLSAFLNALEQDAGVPKTVLYSLNPNDNEMISTVMGCFQTDAPCPGRMQLGSAWWFNDHKPGMEKQLADLAATGVLGSFVGMLTDSRSFVSYPRHEYFRRILCNFIGTLVENGEYPADMDALQTLVANISYGNVKRYFGF